MCNIRKLTQADKAELPHLSTLIFPSHRDTLIESLQETADSFSFVAEIDDTVVGLALVERGEQADSATLHSVFVQKPYRRRGIAQALLERVSRSLVEQGCAFLEASYTSRLKTRETLEALLSNDGWSSPWKRILFCRGDILRIQSEASWVKRAQRTSRGFSIFPWAELSQEDRVELEAGIEAGSIPFELSPFYKEELIQWETSVGLRYHDRVVGWQVNHLIPELPATIRYSRTFVEERFQRMGRAITLMSESVRRHCELVQSEYPHFLSDVAYQREAMVRFYERHLCPHSESVYSSFGIKKQLQVS